MPRAKVLKLPGESEQIPFRLHPRVFQALGSELVTSDVVAVIELVKNSYDAFATRVDVRFGKDADGEYLDVLDNGQGMSGDVIADAWCVVATPFRQSHPTSSSGGRTRRATGAKGLGRLSAARLGRSMELITRSGRDGTWQVEVDWAKLSAADSLDECFVARTPYSGNLLSSKAGTLIRIRNLKSRWTQTAVEELREALSRLISPFEELSDFKILLTPPGAAAQPTRIESSEFLKHPTYCIKGTFDRVGTLNYRYTFNPFTSKPHSRPKTFDWAVVQTDISSSDDGPERARPKEEPECGPFGFEIRVWDLDKQSLLEAESKFSIRGALVRRQIRAFKGISLYRDKVLVLPKSETNRDWLGLDLRRVSRVGTRLSTSQMVGYVAVTADDNPSIEDTSDRERLARNDAVLEFERVLNLIVSRLEAERAQDHEEHEETHVRELFEDLSPKRLIEATQELASEDGSASDVLPVLARFSSEAERARQRIERQFVYYSRLATIGTISEMLIHEVANNCVAIDSFVAAVRDSLSGKETNREMLLKRLSLAEQGVRALQSLAEKFRPMAGRSFQRGRGAASLRDAVEACTATLAEQIVQGKIQVKCNLRGKDSVKVDPGELFPIVYNIIDNAVYWLLHQKSSDRRLEIRSADVGRYVACEISDSGPGIDEADSKRIFFAGVTRKPNGSGMGLTVAGELLESNDGTLSLKRPGRLGGATFRFQIPAA
jgi:signal transduction histidine kinase